MIVLQTHGGAYAEGHVTSLTSATPPTWAVSLGKPSCSHLSHPEQLSAWWRELVNSEDLLLGS